MKIKIWIAILVTVFFLGCSNYTTIEKEAINSMKQEIKAYYGNSYSITFDLVANVFSNDSIGIIWATYVAKHKNDNIGVGKMIEYTYCISNNHKHSLISPWSVELPAKLTDSNSTENLYNPSGVYVGREAYNILKDSILSNKNLNYREAQAYLAIKHLNQSGQRIDKREEKWREMIPVYCKTGHWELENISALSQTGAEENQFITLNSTTPYNYLVDKTEKQVLKIVVGKHKVWLTLCKDTDFILTAKNAAGEEFDLGFWDNRRSRLKTQIYSTISNEDNVFQTLLKEENPFTLTLSPCFVVGRESEEMKPMYFDFYPQGYNEALKQL